MHKRFCSLFCALFLSYTPLSLSAEQAPASAQERRSESFTGQILKSRVRMRLQPSLDAYVFTELNKDDYLLVTGLVDDFYACHPPKGLKGYVFRTYVLDGVVEGSNVNVRLEPDVTSPVITQLNTGDVIKGVLAPQNSKWFQIDLPESVQFYVAKEFVAKVGPPNFYAARQQKLQEVKQTLATVEVNLEQELEKPFLRIQLAPLASQLTRIAEENKDMPQEVQRANALITKMQEAYLAKSLAYGNQEIASPQPEEIATVEIHEEEAPVAIQDMVAQEQVAPAQVPKEVPAKRPEAAISWKEREDKLIQAAASSAEQFYADEMGGATPLKGIIKANAYYGKNRPGDFLLIDEKSGLPIAYLYSTQVDLGQLVNKSVRALGSSRPNNSFAFQAFFVLKIEE